MSLSDRKIADSDLAGKGVIGLNDVPSLDTADMQAKFEELVTAVVKPKHNSLIDDLSSTDADKGADYVGFNAGNSELTATNVGAAIRETKTALDSAVLAAGNVPAGGTTGQVLAKNSNTDRDLKWATPLTDTKYEATISTSWTGDAAPYTQEVTVNGITANDIVKMWVNHSGTLAENKTFDENYNLMNDLDSGANKITLTCFYDKPTVAIPVFLEVIR